MCSSLRSILDLDQSGCFCEGFLDTKGHGVGFYRAGILIWGSHQIGIFSDLMMIRFFLGNKRKHRSGQLRYVCFLWVFSRLCRWIIFSRSGGNLMDLIEGDWVMIEVFMLEYGNLLKEPICHRFVWGKAYGLRDSLMIHRIFRELMEIRGIFTDSLDFLSRFHWGNSLSLYNEFVRDWFYSFLQSPFTGFKLLLTSFSFFLDVFLIPEMTQSQWITKSGGKMVEGSKPVVRVSVPRFDKSAIIATHARTLIGRLMNPPKQNMKMMLFQLPRIWQVEGRVVGTDLGLGRFQFAFDHEEDIVEVLKMEPFFFDNWMISLVRWKPVVEANYPSKIIFWVRPMDIPLQYWDAQTFQSIGEVLGRVHGNVDMVEGRVRVEVDGFKPLVFTMTVDFDEGVEMPITLRYEKLVGYCQEGFCMTHDQSRCSILTKVIEEGSNKAGYEDREANVNSYKTAVMNGREQTGERREGQHGRYQNGREGNKGKGVARDKAGSRFEEAQHKPKDRYHRGNGEGSAMYGRQAGQFGPRVHDREMFPQNRGLQQERQHFTNQEKLMLDAFKGTERSPKLRAGVPVTVPALDGSSSTSKARKALLFEEGPGAEEGNDTGKMMIEVQEPLVEKVRYEGTTLGEQGSHGDKTAEANSDEPKLTEDGTMLGDESNLMEDGMVFDDSDILVDADDLQEWEQGEIPDFAEEEAVEEVEEGRDVEEGSGEHVVLSNEQGDIQGKAPMKVSKGGTLTMGGNSKKRLVQSIISPRKKLLAKAIARTGHVKKIPTKAKTPTE